MTTTAEIHEITGQMVELLEQVQAGHEVLLTQDHRPVAKLVPAVAKEAPVPAPLQIHSLKGHRVLTATISQAELAEEMFRP